MTEPQRPDTEDVEPDDTEESEPIAARAVETTSAAPWERRALSRPARPSK